MTKENNFNADERAACKVKIESPKRHPKMAADSSNFSSTEPFINTHSVNSSVTLATIIIPSSTPSSDLTANVTSPVNATTEQSNDADFSSQAAAILVFVGVMGVAILTVIVYIYTRRRRKLSYLPCTEGRKRRSSTTSFNNPLTTTDDSDVVPRDRELFSIGDQDGGDDGRHVGPRNPVPTDDDYFYDEIFERSAFVDERTNKSNKQLTVDDFDDDFDLPDLTFKPYTNFKTS